jgi:hypothetical protein
MNMKFVVFVITRKPNIFEMQVGGRVLWFVLRHNLKGENRVTTWFVTKAQSNLNQAKQIVFHLHSNGELLNVCERASDTFKVKLLW